MSKTTPGAHTARRRRQHDRRRPGGAPGSVRWMKSLLGRPLALQRRGGQLHVTLVDRRRPPDVIEAEERRQLRDELRARLLAHGDESTTASVMRHLVYVLHVFGRRGWDGVGALGSRVLGRATVQAQMLATQDPSPTLTQAIETMRLLQVAASVREEQQDSTTAREEGQTVEVSESSLEEYEQTERGWLDTVSPSPAQPIAPMPDGDR